MNKRLITQQISPDVIMYIGGKKIFIRCPYKPSDKGDCLAYNTAKDSPIKLNIKFQEFGLGITPKYIFTGQTRDLIAKQLYMACKVCAMKRRTLETTKQRTK